MSPSQGRRKLTVTEALSEATSHHQQGRLQEAEHLYRAILANQPAHPEANHNLGVLALQVGKPALGLPYLKAALEGAPHQERFWIDYGEGLLAADRPDEALQALERALPKGAGDASATQKLYERARKAAARDSHPGNGVTRHDSADKASPGPPQAEVDELIALYQSAPTPEALQAAIHFSKRWPEAAVGWMVRFNCHHLTGQLEDALHAAQQAVRLNPTVPELYLNLGVALGRLDQLKAAESAYRQALELQPDYVQVHYNLGNTLGKLHRLRDAEAAYRQALAIKPDYAEAHYNLANTLRELGRFEEATTSYQHALAINPDNADAHNNLGAVLRDLGRLEEAEAAFREALATNPNYATAHNNLATTLKEAGRLEEAEAAYLHALAIKPDYAEAHYNVGSTLRDLGRLEEAEAYFRHALAINPGYAEAYNNLGAILQGLGRFDEAEAAYRQALDTKPDNARSHYNLGNLFRDRGCLEEALACYERAIALNPRFHDAHSSRLLLLNSHVAFHPLMEEGIRHWLRCCVPEGKPERFKNSRDTNRQLRIGLVSPDLRRHSVAYFIEALFRGRDHNAYRLYAYSVTCKEDEVSTRLRGHADRWHACCGWNDERLRRQILEDDIDILVDLAGHTGGNRLLLFGRRAAPVQISYLGYPDVTGLPTMDYRITDGRADPIDDPRDVAKAGREALLRLPESFLCFAPPAEAPAVGDPPMIERGHVTFGSFNNLAKLTSEMVAVWAEILRRTPGSRLTLKSRALADARAQRHIESLFQRRGIDPARLRLLGMIPGLTGHLALYNEVDVALDAYPYHGTTTTCEALWMGVPVVTLKGGRHVSRVGTSLLSGIGLDELVANDESEYMDIAVTLAGDPGKLGELRQGMRARMLAAPLMDEEGFNRAMEGFFREVWGHWVESVGD